METKEIRELGIVGVFFYGLLAIAELLMPMPKEAVGLFFNGEQSAWVFAGFWVLGAVVMLTTAIWPEQARAAVPHH